MLSRTALFVLSVGVVSAACESAGTAGAAAQHVRIVTGGPTGSYYRFGSAMARLYSEDVPGISASAEPMGASIFNVNALNSGSADLGFARADIAYTAYVRGTPLDRRPHEKLRGVAVVFMNALHVVVRRDSPLRRLADLRGARVGWAQPYADVSPPVSYVDLVGASGEVAADEMEAVGMSEELLPSLLEGSVGSAFWVVGYPMAALAGIANGDRVRLLEVEPQAASRIRAKFPFYKPVVIAANTYPWQQEDVQTIGVESLILSRADLDDDLVYRLTKAFFEGLPRLASENEVAARVDPDLAPAVPIPLHRGAARYYRERELLR